MKLRGLVFALALGMSTSRAHAVPTSPAKAPPKAQALAPQVAAPVRPAPGDLDTRARLLFEAIQRDEPDLATPVFFPRAAFIRVKAMQKPERYYDRLYARFQTDIHALHRALPGLARAMFTGLRLSPRGGFMKVGTEGNRLPYWASRHAALTYTLDGANKELEVRVLITWDDRWYVIHLSEFQ
jgi:hypothetical protein